MLYIKDSNNIQRGQKLKQIASLRLHGIMKTFEHWIPLMYPDAWFADVHDTPSASENMHVHKYPLVTNPRKIWKQECCGNNESLRNIQIIFN